MAIQPDSNDPTHILSAPMTSQMAVLFADVAGSTKLYDTLGDARAKELVDECLALMTEVVKKHDGRVIKTIGDEVMCVLSSADNGCLAAMKMQLGVDDLLAHDGVKRAIRVGFHFGPVIEESDDVFGDTVNLAARMAGLAKARQIITTATTVQQMSPALRFISRRIAALAVKGKGDDVEVFDVIWQPNESVTIMAPTFASAVMTAELHLQHGGNPLVLKHTDSSIVLGRDAACELMVRGHTVSRQHARIERRRDKFFLIDQSTNGTYVAFVGEPEITLRREEVVLRTQGRIALGHSVDSMTDEVISFTVRG
jgi:class 3 adenylate cyclase